MPFRLTLLPLAAAILLGACTSTGGTGASATPPASAGPSVAGGPPSMDGHTYVSTAVHGHDLAAGTRVTLMFRDGQLGAGAGCNSMSGSYRIAGDALHLDQMATTEMACQADLMAQDQWLAAFLPDAAITLDGTTLTLANGGVTMTLVDQQTTNLPLEGTVWTVDGLIAGDAVSSVPQGVTATLAFAAGRVSVRAGCNSGRGEASIADGEITFGPIGLTKMACGDAAMSVEQKVTAVLQGTQPYSIAGDALLLGVSGKDGLMLKGGQPGTTPLPGPT
jgi:heat shock protein HslJ